MDKTKTKKKDNTYFKIMIYIVMLTLKIPLELNMLHYKILKILLKN